MGGEERHSAAASPAAPAHALDRLFRPRAIAVIGASTRADAIGFRVIRNLRQMGFAGRIFPVNPRYREVAGLACLPSVEALPDGIDAAFIAIPAEQGAALLDAVGRRGIKAAFVNASGFADGGEEGRARQRHLAETARRHGIALCGPNNMGLINVHDGIAPWTQLNLTNPRPGPVAVVSQSGSIALVLAHDERRLGLAYLVTAGNEALLGVADYLDWIVRDDRVRTVLVFLETIRDPARFGAAAEEARRRGKRIIALKTGSSPRGRLLVAAHTDALAGEDRVYDAFFRRHGILRARDLDELIETAVLVTAYPEPPRSRHLVPVTLSGGEAALIADLSARIGLELQPLSAATTQRLQPAFPPFARPSNPLDGWGLGFNAERFAQMLEALAADETIGAIGLAIDAAALGGADTGYAMTMARLARPLAAQGKRIVFFNNTVGSGPNLELRAALDEAGIPYLSGMSPALAAIAGWLSLAKAAPQAEDATRAAGADADAWRARLRAPTLAEAELLAMMREAGIAMVEQRVVASAAEAVAAAEALGYPVVLKASAPQLPHKSEHDLVRLDLGSAEAVRAAYAALEHRLRALREPAVETSIIIQPMLRQGVELVIGIRHEPGFGPLVMAGLGGVFVELLDEVAWRLAPIDAAEARAMLAETRAARLLGGFRGRGPYDIAAAAEAIAALSRFAAATAGLVGAIEINPLIVRERGAFGVDLLLRRRVPSDQPHGEEQSR